MRPEAPRSKKKQNPFIQVPKAAIEDPRLEKTHLLVLLSLCSFMNAKTRKCFPSIAAVAQGARMSAPRTRQKINDLVELGFVERARSGGGRYATTYFLYDKEYPEKPATPPNLTDRGIHELPPAPDTTYRAPLNAACRGNNKNKTTNIEQYLSIERGDVLKILKICNDFRSRRFDLDPLSEEEEHLKHISRALKAYSFEDVERVAKHYFATADCEFLNTYNAFNLPKLRNKIQRARDYKAQDSVKVAYKDIPLAKLISGARHA